MGTYVTGVALGHHGDRRDGVTRGVGPDFPAGNTSEPHRNGGRAPSGHVVASAGDAARPARRPGGAGDRVRERARSTSWASRCTRASSWSPTSSSSTRRRGGPTPTSWRSWSARAAEAVSVLPCTEAALADQPTRYVQAAAAVLASPGELPGRAGPPVRRRGRAADGDGQPRRPGGDGRVGPGAGAPYGAVHRHRARPRRRRWPPWWTTCSRGSDAEAPQPGPACGAGPEYVVDGRPGDRGRRRGGRRSASAAPALDEPDACALTLTVDPAWRRQGIGSRLLSEAVRVAAARQRGDWCSPRDADNQAVLPMVLAAGMRGRIRMSGDRLTVRIPLAALHR